MSLISIFRIVQSSKITIFPSQYAIQANTYAVAPVKGKKKKFGQAAEKKELPFEKDVDKLLTYVCGSNIYIEGKDVEIKPDSEYPDWLWKIRTGPAVPLEELDPNTKAYWRRLRTYALRQKNKLAKCKKF